MLTETFEFSLEKGFQVKSIFTPFGGFECSLALLLWECDLKTWVNFFGPYLVSGVIVNFDTNIFFLSRLC